MPITVPTIDANKLDLGAVQVKYKGVDLGSTLGNATVSYKYSKAPVKADQLGDTELNKFVTGLVITITTELAETGNKDNWKVVFPNAQEISTGSKLIRFVPGVGGSDLAIAGALVLHPLNKASSDYSGDYTFPLAVSTEESEIVHGPAEQKKLKVVWTVYPDTAVVGFPMAYYGDTSIGVVAASAGSPSFSGTGNGTLGTVSVFSGVTKSETITVKCVGASSGNDFYVSGSVSGPLGEGHISAASSSTLSFSSGAIAFVITQGSTQFAYNDEFTIVTTSANYS